MHRCWSAGLPAILTAVPTRAAEFHNVCGDRVGILLGARTCGESVGCLATAIEPTDEVTNQILRARPRSPHPQAAADKNLEDDLAARPLRAVPAVKPSYSNNRIKRV
jgi:hypothetical protein